MHVREISVICPSMHKREMLVSIFKKKRRYVIDGKMCRLVYQRIHDREPKKLLEIKVESSDMETAGNKKKLYNKISSEESECCHS